MRLPPVEEAAQTAATATTFTLGFALAAEEAAAAFGRRVAVAPPVARAVAPAAASDDDDVEMTKEVCELSVSSSRSRVQTVRTALPPRDRPSGRATRIPRAVWLCWRPLRDVRLLNGSYPKWFNLSCFHQVSLEEVQLEKREATRRNGSFIDLTNDMSTDEKAELLKQQQVRRSSLHRDRRPGVESRGLERRRWRPKALASVLGRVWLCWEGHGIETHLCGRRRS